jgi:hypothetical protein
MNASSKAQAWEMANKIFPTDYEKDEGSSARAGYDIYRMRGDWCPSENYYNWISDLGNRLEINLANGETVNIWIEEEKPEFSEGSLESVLEIVDETLYQINDNISLKLQEKTGIDEARKQIYGAYKIIAEILKKDYPESKLYERFNLKDA